MDENREEENESSPRVKKEFPPSLLFYPLKELHFFFRKMSLSLSNWNVSVRLPESLSASFGSMWFGFCPAPQPPDSPGESLLPMCILLGETIATARCYKYSTVVLEHPRLLEWFRKQLL